MLFPVSNLTGFQDAADKVIGVAVDGTIAPLDSQQCQSFGNMAFRRTGLTNQKNVFLGVDKFERTKLETFAFRQLRIVTPINIFQVFSLG